MKRKVNSLRIASIVCGLSLISTASHAAWKLYGITGQQTDTTPADSGTGFKYPDHTLVEINTSNAAVSPLFTLTWINDSQAIGFCPTNNLIYHTGGSEAYSNNPERIGHDQGGPEIPGVGYQDSQYMETVDPVTGAMNGVFNADPCPNPDPTLPCFGLTAPRPDWVLPTERRDSTQTDQSFRETGPNEYHAARGLTWSTDKKLFYLTDELGVFTMTPQGESTFVGRPTFPTDGQNDEAKSIAFIGGTNLWVGHRSAGLVIRIDPDTAEVLEEVALSVPEGGGEPTDNFNGLLGMAQDPETGVIYGVRATSDFFSRELVTINLTNGVTTLVGNLGMHVASIAFGEVAGAAAEIRVAITNQTDGTITLSWSGDPGRYLVQKKIDLGSPTWFDVISTTDQSVTVAKDGQMGFYRIVGNYTGPDVIPLTAFLSAQGEKPATTSTGTGVANLSVAGNTLNYMVTYGGLSGNASAAHIHGVGDSQSTSLPVILPFTNPSGKSGYISGTVAMTDQQKTDVLAGRTYVNVHSSANPGGEIRGQAMRTVYTATMNGANEQPTPVTTAGTGTAKFTIYGRELKYEVNWSNLSGSATAGHIHGRADATGTAIPIVTFTGVTGATGSTTGIVQASVATLEAIVDGMTYANIHTGNNPGGEIRGQLAAQ
jgi:hypothetical protein